MTGTDVTGETRRANARLRTVLTRADRDFALAKKLLKAAQPPVPDVGPRVTVDVRHVPGHPTGTDWWAVSRVGSVVRVVLADAAGPATPAGAMFPLFLRSVVARYAELSPGDLFAAVNRDLTALEFEDPPVVAMTVLRLDAETGKFVVARAGAPRPAVETVDGSTTEITLPGPLLGVFDGAAFPDHAGELRPGEQVVLKTDGVADSGDDATCVVIGFDGC
jgi:serine phosphatase RsbU (regulator of sigma subunit)